MMGQSTRNPLTRSRAASALLVLATLGLGCGGDDLDCTGPFCVTPPTRPDPSRLEAGPNNGQQGFPNRELDEPVGVVVRDEEGDPVSGVTVTFSVKDGGGDVSSGIAESNVDGVASVNWTLGGQLGPQHLEATATNEDGAPLTGSPLELRAEAVPPQPARLVLRTTLSTTAENGVPLDPQPAVEVFDADDQPVPNVEILASVASGNATVSGSATAVSGADGAATFDNLALVGPQGPQTLRFSVASPALEITSGEIQLSAGTAATLEPVGPTSFEGTVNSPVSPSPSVVAKDGAGNPVPGVAVTFTPNRNASVSPETATTDAQGVAQASWTLGSSANGSYTLTARIESSPAAPVRFSATAQPGNAGRLRIATQPSSPTASGSAFATQPVIQLVDQNGNPTSQAGVRVTANVSSGPSGTVQNETATTDASGRATFSGLTLTGQVGSYTLTFSAPGLVGATSSPFAITVGPAAKLAVTRVPSTLARSRGRLVIQPEIQIQDASGNPVRQAGTVVVASVTAPFTTLTGESGTTDANGLAAFTDLTITGIPGPRDLTFSATGLQSASARVTVVSVETVTGVVTHPTEAVVASTVAGPVITWTFLDASRRPIADADFSIVLPSGGTVDAPQFSDEFGAVQLSNWMLGTAAGYQYIILRLPSGREFRDSILATPGPPTRLVIASGDDQEAPAGQDLPLPLVVRVVDQWENGVAGVPVQWATCDGVAGPTLNTDASGYSSVSQPTTQATENGCTRASITQPSAFVDFSYRVTAAASQEEPPAGVSTSQSRHTGGPPPVRLRPPR